MSKGRGKAPSQRQLRVGEELRHALSAIIARGELRDPALAGLSITVTEVEVSPDLKNATAYVVPLGGGDVDEIVTALGHAAGFLRHEIGRMVDLRYLPALHFAADRSFDTAERIERALKDPNVARDLGPQEEDDGSAA